MPIQYGPPTQIIRYGSGSAGTAAQPLLAGSFASAFSRRPAAAAKKKPASSAAPVSQTLAQVANQRVNQQLNPQIAAQDAFNAHQNAVIQSFANSLLGKMQPIAGQVGAEYDSAINQQGALANQAAQFLQNANPTGQVHDLLASINAPQEQQTQLANQFGQTFGGGAGVLSFTGGAIPGSQMAANKAAAVGEAAQLPGFAALKGQQDLASALWQQGQDRRTLEATRPALYQAAAQDIRQNNAARATAGATARQNAITNARENRKINIGVQQFNISEQDKADIAAARATAATTAAKTRARQDFLTFVGKHPGMSSDEVNAVAGVYGIDVGKGFSTPATPVKPIIIGSDKAGRWSYDTTTGKLAQLTPPVAGAPVKPIIIGSDKAGRWAYDPTTGTKTQLTKPIAGGTGSSPKIIGSDKAGRWAYDPGTHTLTPLIKPIKGSTKTAGLTGNAAATARGKAAAIAHFALTGTTRVEKNQKFKPTTDPGTITEGWSEPTADGTGWVNHYPSLTFDQAVDEAEQEGIPPGIYLPKLTKAFHVTVKFGGYPR